MRDPYEVLGVPRSATADDIKKSFRRLAKKLHPDANKNDPKAAARFAELNSAHEILGEVRHNTVYFPNVMVKGAVQILRNFIPLAVDRTLVESWVFRLAGAPDKLYERALMYNRFINAPTSIVGHDDLEMYERAQEGLRSNGNQWVNLRRLYETGEEHDVTAVVNGTSERQMRNQFHAWAKFMTLDMNRPGEVAE